MYTCNQMDLLGFWLHLGHSQLVKLTLRILSVRNSQELVIRFRIILCSVPCRSPGQANASTQPQQRLKLSDFQSCCEFYRLCWQKDFRVRFGSDPDSSGTVIPYSSSWLCAQNDVSLKLRSRGEKCWLDVEYKTPLKHTGQSCLLWSMFSHSVEFCLCTQC